MNTSVNFQTQTVKERSDDGDNNMSINERCDFIYIKTQNEMNENL